MGDGALIVNFDDGTKTSAEWKCMTINYGPTEASRNNGCSATNLNACELEITEEPTNW